MRRISDREAHDRCWPCAFLHQWSCYYRVEKGERGGHAPIVQIVNCPRGPEWLELKTKAKDLAREARKRREDELAD